MYLILQRTVHHAQYNTHNEHTRCILHKRLFNTCFPSYMIKGDAAMPDMVRSKCCGSCCEYIVNGTYGPTPSTTICSCLGGGMQGLIAGCSIMPCGIETSSVMCVVVMVRTDGDGQQTMGIAVKRTHACRILSESTPSQTLQRSNKQPSVVRTWLHARRWRRSGGWLDRPPRRWKVGHVATCDGLQRILFPCLCCDPGAQSQAVRDKGVALHNAARDLVIGQDLWDGMG